MNVYLASMSVADDRNESGTEIIGIYSTPGLAWAAALAAGPGTATIERYEVDGDDFEVLAWREWDGRQRRLVTKGPLAPLLGEEHQPGESG